MDIALAALSALVWGTADFAGGKGAQRTPALVVTVLSKACSLPALALYLVLLRAPINGAALGWGALAGTFGVIGIVTFYRALAAGAMTVVAPISACTCALLPLVVGVVIDGSPGTLRLVGAGLAVIAIALVSATPGVHGQVTRKLVVLAAASGLMFGLFFVFIGRAGAAAGGNAGLWPILSAQLAALIVCAVLLIRGGTTPRATGASVRWIVVAGVLDMSANALYLLAVQLGPMSVVAPAAALYPVSTVLLALIIDRERVRSVQVAGLGLAAAALVLVAT